MLLFVAHKQRRGDIEFELYVFFYTVTFIAYNSDYWRITVKKNLQVVFCWRIFASTIKKSRILIESNRPVTANIILGKGRQ